MAIKQGANMQINQEQHGLQTISLDQKISRLQIHGENAEHDGTDISMEICGYKCIYYDMYASACLTVVQHMHAMCATCSVLKQFDQLKAICNISRKNKNKRR